MKNTLKTVAIALGLLLGAGVYAQTNVYAKENPNKAKAKPAAAAVKTSPKGNKSSKEAVPFGLLKKEDASKASLPPVIKDGGVLIPVKAITKSFGANLTWDSENQTVTITKGETTIVINLGTKTATVNGTEVALQDDSTANNGTLVPLKFIAENLGIDLDKTDAEQDPTTTDTQTSTTTDTTASTSTDSQASTTTDVQAPTTTDTQASTSTDTQSSTDSTVVTSTQN